MDSTMSYGYQSSYMAISDFYSSTVVKVRAYFGFSNFTCDPDEITSHLAVEPDEVGRKGALRVVVAGRRIEWPFNSWSISSHVESKDVNEHLRELFDRLCCVSHDLPERFGEPTFSVRWKSNNLYSGSGPFFEADVIAGIARLRASLFQDIYQVDQAPESDLTDSP